MSERLTVVFDDDELYRRLKVWAAERGVPVKRVIQDAVASYIGPAPESLFKPIDWDAFQEWQREAEALDQQVGPYSPRLSSVKESLYASDDDRPQLRLAEERAEYDA